MSTAMKGASLTVAAFIFVLGLPFFVNAQAGTVLAPSTGPVTARNSFGTQTTILMDGIDGTSRESVRAALKRASDAGYGWVRDYVRGHASTGEDLSHKWDVEQQVEGRRTDLLYPWFFEATKEYRLRPLIGLHFWFDGHNKFPSTEAGYAAYGQFCGAMAKNYKGYVTDWEVDNELNIQGVTAVQYVRMTEACSKAIKAVDPTAKIYGPALAMLESMNDGASGFLHQALAAGLLSHIDVFSYHPYRQGYGAAAIPEIASEFHPWQKQKTYVNQINNLRTLLQSYRKGFSAIAASEVGFSTSIKDPVGGPVSELTQAKYEQRDMLLHAAFSIPRINFILQRYTANLGGNTHELEFRMLDDSNRPRPVYRAVQALMGQFAASLAPTTLSCSTSASSAKNVQCHAFSKPNGELVVALWAGVPASDSYVSENTSVTLVTGKYGKAKVIDLFPSTGAGRVTTKTLALSYADGRTTVQNVPLKDSPVLLVLTRGTPPKAILATLPTLPEPTARFTVNGVTDVTLKPGDAYRYEWKAENADQFSSNYTAICANGARPNGTWAATTNSGSESGKLIDATAYGCTYTITYKAIQSATGKEASKSVTVAIRGLAILAQSKDTTGVNEPFTVSWDSTNANSCGIEYNFNNAGWVSWGSGTSGSQVSTPPAPGSLIFRITCAINDSTSAVALMSHTIVGDSARRTPSPQIAGVAGAFAGSGESTKPVPAFSYTFTIDLYRGQSGAEVRALQEALKAEGLFSGDSSGNFFDQTVAAVRAFQLKHGITATGYVGAATRAALNARFAP